MIGHLWRLVRLRLLRFRLETFGLYFPSLPHERSWWRVTLPALALFIRRYRPYARWANDVRSAARLGPRGWWQRRLAPADRVRWAQSLRELNS